MITIGIPQLIFIVLGIISLIVSIVRHGELQGEYNAGATLLALIIQFGLLIWGGFFG